MASTGNGIAGRVFTGSGVTSSPRFAEIGTDSGLTQFGVVLGGGSGPFTVSGAGTAGYVLTSNGAGSAPTYISLSSAGALTKLTGDTGGAISPSAGNINLLGSGSLTTSGSGSTITYNLTGLTNHAVLVGAGTTTITKVGPTATSGQVLQSAGSSADPAFSTATYPATTTINQILYSSAADTVTGLATGNNGVLITSATGVPSLLANGTTGQVLTATTGSPPSWTSIAGTDYHDSRYIVGAGGATDGANYTTIASALADAVIAGAPQTIFIQPGTYTENLTLSAGINFAAHSCDAETPNVTIVGKMTFTAAGSVSISGIRLQTNADYILEITGTAASVVIFKDCYINATNNSAFSSTTSSTTSEIRLLNCNGNINTAGTAYFSISNGIIKFWGCDLKNLNNSSTASTAANASSVILDHTIFDANITTSGTSSFSARYCAFRNGSAGATVLTINGTGTNAVSDCTIEGGTASCLSIGTGNNMDVFDCKFDSTNANVITGAGNALIGNAIFTSTSSTINTTTQTPQIGSNDALKIVTPGAYPYTTVPQDAVILIDTSTTRTITPLASPTTGQKHIIKDNVGSAGTNNITITPSGKNVDGSASYVINTDYGSATIVYNGTQWNII